MLLHNKNITFYKVNPPACTITFLILIILPFLSLSQSGEYMVKAAFLEKFTKFIEWPQSSGIDDKTKPFVISVIGKNPFDDILDYVYKHKIINEKQVEINYISQLSEIEGSHILFISKSEQKNLLKILEITKNKPILTIGDTYKYAEKGVLINFYVSNNKVRFEINETAVQSSGLYMNFRLLSLAKIVNPHNH